MFKLAAKSSYHYEILHEISNQLNHKRFLNCKLIFSDGVIECHAAMLQYCRVWWIHCSSCDNDEFTVILPEMLVAEGVTMLNKIYSGNKALMEDTDCNNNSLDDSLDDSPGSSDIGGISETSATIPASPGLDDETLDKQLACDHADIDKLFSGSSYNDIPEYVKTRGNIRVSSGQNKDIKQFLDTCDAVDIKMGQVKVRIEQISSESDLGLRSDLVEMETQQIEAEVATSISRGETLILMIHRQDPTQAENLQSRVNHLRNNWQTVKGFADTKKHEAEIPRQDSVPRSVEDLELKEEVNDDMDEDNNLYVDECVDTHRDITGGRSVSSSQEG